MELLKEKIDHIISNEGSIIVKIAILIMCIILFSFVFVYFRNKMDYVIILLLLSCLFLFIEIRLLTNVTFAKTKCSVQHVIKTAKTGDLFFARSYHSYDLPEFVFYRCISSLVSKIYFGHVGMFFRHPKSGELYILECTEDFYMCHISNFNKNGVIMHPALKRLQEYDGRVHYVSTNLDLNSDCIFQSVNNYKHYSFLHNNMGCCQFVRMLFHSCGVMSDDYWVPRCCYFINPKNYNVNIQISEPLEIIRHK